MSSEWRQVLSGVENAVENFNHPNSQFTSTLIKLRNQLESANAKAVNANLALTKQELAKVRSVVAEAVQLEQAMHAETQVEGLEARVKELEAQLADAEKMKYQDLERRVDLDELVDDLEIAEKTLTVVDAQKSALNSEIQALNERLEGGVEERVEQIRVKVEAVRAKVAATQAETEALEQAVRHLSIMEVERQKLSDEIFLKTRDGNQSNRAVAGLRAEAENLQAELERLKNFQLDSLADPDMIEDFTIPPIEQLEAESDRLTAQLGKN